MKPSKKVVNYLLKLVHADLHRMDKEMDHAACYGSEVVLEDYESAGQAQAALLDELKNAG